MTTRKHSPRALPCGHKSRDNKSWGLVTCSTCGAPEEPNRIPEYQISERITLQPGDIIKVQGIKGYGIYHYALINQPSGDAIEFHQIEDGRWGKHRSVFADRVRRAPKNMQQRTS